MLEASDCESTELILANPGLKQALLHAIKQQHYEDVVLIPQIFLFSFPLIILFLLAILQKAVQHNTLDCPQLGALGN